MERQVIERRNVCIEVLQQLLKQREMEHKELMEFNNFTAADDDAWCKKTRELQEELDALKRNEDMK